MLLHFELPEEKVKLDQKDDDTVYHVANPDVPGKPISKKDSRGYVDVLFKEPVGFSGNPQRGLAMVWGCSVELLYPTSAEAWKNKIY